METAADLDQKAVDALVRRWARATADLEPRVARVPLGVLLMEAGQVAAVVDEHFSPCSKTGRPGLASVVRLGEFSEHTSREMRELALVVSAQSARLRAERRSLGPSRTAEARALIREIRLAHEFVFEMGRDAHGSQQLEQLRVEYRHERSQDGLAMALEGYAALLSQHSGQVLPVTGLAPDTVDRALDLANRLRHRSGDLMQVLSEQRAATRFKNRLVAALCQRLCRARAAIRYVFRDDPEIRNKVRSRYGRQ